MPSSNRLISKLMTDTALDSVQTNLNLAFSDLEVSLLEEGNAQPNIIIAATPKQLNEKPTLDLDFDEIAELPEKVYHK